MKRLISQLISVINSLAKYKLSFAFVQVLTYNISEMSAIEYGASFSWHKLVFDNWPTSLVVIATSHVYF